MCDLSPFLTQLLNRIESSGILALLDIICSAVYRGERWPIICSGMTIRQRFSEISEILVG